MEVFSTLDYLMIEVHSRTKHQLLYLSISVKMQNIAMTALYLLQPLWRNVRQWSSQCCHDLVSLRCHAVNVYWPDCLYLEQHQSG